MTAVTLRFPLVLTAHRGDTCVFRINFQKIPLKRNKIYYLKIGLFIRFVFVCVLVFKSIIYETNDAKKWI